MKHSNLLALFSCLVSTAPAWGRIWQGSASPGMEEAVNFQLEQLENMRSFLGPADFTSSHTKRDSVVKFNDPRADEFLVDGSKLPLVSWDAGPSWAGLLPISSDPDETRKLFFWFWPTTNASNANDLVFWTQGGPGCSSLQGMLQENGPISWNWGQSEATPNSWSWTSLANVIWVEQPVGTGFSQGIPNVSNADEVAAQLVGFMQQFLDVFSELKGSNFFATGESYGGYYVPYIANYIYEHPGVLDVDLKGIWISDPSVSWDLVQHDIVTPNFVKTHPDLFPFNQSFTAQLQNASDACGFTDYVVNFVTYPPAGQLPLPPGATIDETTKEVSVLPECQLHSLVQAAATLINPVFNIFRASDSWPSLWSILGYPQTIQEFVYFNRTDVQDAIHAPRTNWTVCTSNKVFTNGTAGVPGKDTSVPSMLSVLPNVIEKSVRTVVVHGQQDFILIAEGTRIAIQNMTWNGLQGFQTPIEPDTFIVRNMGAFGSMHQERNLTYVEFPFSGHMTPQFVPWATFQTIAYLLGKQPSPSV